MRLSLTLSRLILPGAFLMTSLPGLAVADDSPTVRFSRDVLPILSENCLLCHGPDAKARKADLRLDLKESTLRTKEPIVVPGKSDESELIRRVESDDPRRSMPPPKSGKKLTASRSEMLKQWVDQGAEVGQALGLRASRPGRSAQGEGRRLGPEPDRPVRPGPARGGRAQAVSPRPTGPR